MHMCVRAHNAHARAQDSVAQHGGAQRSMAQHSAAHHAHMHGTHTKIAALRHFNLNCAWTVDAWRYATRPKRQAVPEFGGDSGIQGGAHKLLLLAQYC